MNVNINDKVTVKQYAESAGVSIQAVHQQLKRQKNKGKLEGHVHVIDGIKYLDEEAVAILNSSREKTPVVEWNQEKDKRIKELEADVERNRKYIVALEIANTNYLERNILLEGQVKQLEESTKAKDEEIDRKVKEAVEAAEVKTAAAIKAAEDRVKLEHQEAENKLRTHYQEELEELRKQLEVEKNKSWWDKLRGK